MWPQRNTGSQNIGSRNAGSVLLATLFVSIGCCLFVLVLNGLVAAALRAALTEKAGDSAQAAAEQVLGELRLAALQDWQPRAVLAGDATTAQLTPPSADIAQDMTIPAHLLASATVPSGIYEGKRVEARVLSGVLERGWDGVDLPEAAVVANNILLDSDRTTPGIPGAVVPVATLYPVPETIGEVAWRELNSPWWLDEGTVAWLQEGPGRAPNVDIQEGRAGVRVQPSIEAGSTSAASPLLFLLSEAGAIDARHLGELWGVLVAPEGVLLEGTTLHGAVYSAGNVVLGASGCVVYEEAVRRWACDRSLYRVRLIPGTRLEGWADAG